MRQSLRQSIADSPVRGFERYAKGSIVLCNACAKPVFVLDRSICLGDKAGAMASAFKPLTAAHVVDLSRREDIDAGLRAMLRSWTPEQVAQHVQRLREMRAGDAMACPACDGCFAQVVSIEESEVRDRAHTLELLTVPPEGDGRPAPVRGKHLGASKDWLHEHRVH
jgi:hypothetical protein